MTIYVPDVGDGLAMGIRTLDGTHIQIDCGSQQSAELALSKGLHRIVPHAFFLSHFHTDHYNGLLAHINQCSSRFLEIEEVFYPRIPEFQQRETFLQYMFAMAHRVMGDTSGSMAADFLSLLSRINCTTFSYQSISMGDSISIGGSKFDVLWPPKTVDDRQTLRVIASAINDFEAAMNEDESLRKILDTIGERGEVQPYLSTEQQVKQIPKNDEQNGKQEVHRFLDERRELPQAVQKANKSLRAAANHLSLAFHEDNKFLFMGDLNGSEIKRVVAALTEKRRNHFFTTITPHHGTHWHNDLRQLRTCHSICSVGPGLFNKLSPEFKTMSDIRHITHLNGDVEIPMLVSGWYGLNSWRYWRTFL